MRRSALIGAAILIALFATDAAAQGFVSPYLGTLSSLSPGGSRSKLGYGMAFGKLGRKKASLDTEIAYYPQVLDQDADPSATSRALMFSADWLVGPMLKHVKPYGAFGLGDMYLRLKSPAADAPASPLGFASTKNYITVNGGAGAMVFFNKHVGVRGDVRRFRGYELGAKDAASADGSGDAGGSGLSAFTLTHADFWRFGIGLVATFGSERPTSGK